MMAHPFPSLIDRSMDYIVRHDDTLELLCVRFEVGACVIASAWLDNRTDLE